MSRADDILKIFENEDGAIVELLLQHGFKLTKGSSFAKEFLHKSKKFQATMAYGYTQLSTVKPYTSCGGGNTVQDVKASLDKHGIK